ncbi:related to integral membrane protein [Rhynchosporium agropyri]|uniref:Related to integral membrane protein n=1 Tax=Rhynchosporium agropyri TaxID=914238 RepID=A0A1E1K7U3_9HELO|nr:related to integral membrane protein [Rhynchosporium agropyri]
MADVDLTGNRQGELRATSIAITILAVFVVGLRFLSRWMKGIGFGVDDFMILVALFFLFAAFATCVIGIHFGLGMHAAALEVPQIVSYAKSLIAFECLYVTCICFTKISLLLMYLRIFPVRSIRIGAYILGGLSIAWCISIIMVSIFQCTPIEKTWNSSIPGFCINLKGSFIGNAIPNILTDVAILALPMQQVWSLHTSTMQKVQISIVFLLGSFVIFTSIYRFTTLFQFQPADITWTLATAEVWCVVESASGIISACLPTLGHLVQVCTRKMGVSSPTWGSRARATGPSANIVTIGGGGGGKGKSGNSKNSKGTMDTYDDDLKSASTDTRPFRRLSGVSYRSGATQENHDWEPHSNMKSNVRAHDVESMGSDEIPLQKIMIKTELEWKESHQGNDGGRV